MKRSREPSARSPQGPCSSTVQTRVKYFKQKIVPSSVGLFETERIPTCKMGNRFANGSQKAGGNG
jgi:hypothetical protein